MSDEPRDNGSIQTTPAVFCAQKIAERELRCRRCHAALGYTSQITLTLGDGVTICQQVTLHCPVCGAARSWRPLHR